MYGLYAVLFLYRMPQRRGRPLKLDAQTPGNARRCGTRLCRATGSEAFCRYKQALGRVRGELPRP